MEASNSPGIVGWKCDEYAWPPAVRVTPAIQSIFLMPEKTQPPEPNSTLSVLIVRFRLNQHVTAPIAAAANNHGSGQMALLDVRTMAVRNVENVTRCVITAHAGIPAAPATPAGSAAFAPSAR